MVIVCFFSNTKGVENRWEGSTNMRQGGSRFQSSLPLPGAEDASPNPFGHHSVGLNSPGWEARGDADCSWGAAAVCQAAFRQLEHAAAAVGSQCSRVSPDGGQRADSRDSKKQRRIQQYSKQVKLSLVGLVGWWPW